MRTGLGHHVDSFNSNGWLKSCERNSSTGCAPKALAGTDDYVGSAPGIAPGGCCADAASSPGPMPPSSGFEDFHFPPEEPEELAAMLAAMPVVVSAAGVTGNGFGKAVLGLGNFTATVAVNDTVSVFGGQWGVVSFMVFDNTQLNAAAERHVTVVLERMFDRWSALVYLPASPKGSAAPPPVVVRSGIGALEKLVQPSYTFADPCYFERATETPADYLGYAPAPCHDPPTPAHSHLHPPTLPHLPTDMHPERYISHRPLSVESCSPRSGTGTSFSVLRSWG